MEPSKLVDSYLASLIELKEARERAYETAIGLFASAWENAGLLSRELQTLLHQFRINQRSEPIRVTYSCEVVEAYGQKIRLPKFRQTIVRFDGVKSSAKRYSAVEIKHLNIDFYLSTFKFQSASSTAAIWERIYEIALRLEALSLAWVRFNKSWKKNYLYLTDFNQSDGLDACVSGIGNLFSQIVRLEESIDDALFEFNFKMPSRYRSIKVRWDEKVPTHNKRFGCAGIKFVVYLYFPRNSQKRIGLDVTSFKRKYLEKVSGSKVTPWVTEELISKSRLGRKRNYILSFQTRLKKLLKERELHLSVLVSFIENFSE